MKDGIILLIAGITCAVCASMFWHFLGSDAADITMFITLLLAMADNFRLRRLLCKKK